MTSVVVIIEGVSEPLLKKYLDENQLPFLKKVIQRGCYNSVDTGAVPYEPSNLATAFSGQNPGHHGCFSYWSIHEHKDNYPRILDSSDVKTQRIWQCKEMKDIRWGVLNVQLTHKPQPINGYLISYLMNHSLRACYPPSLLRDLQKDGTRFAHDVSVLYKGEPLEAYSDQIFQVAGFQLDTALTIAPLCDTLIVNLTVVDRLSHFMWHEVENANLDKKPELLKAYQFLDDAIERLNEYVGKNDSLLIFSEIGFGGIDHFVSINDYLESAGYLVKNQDNTVNKAQSVAYESVQGSHGICISPNLSQQQKSSTNEERYSNMVNEVSNYLHNITFNDGSRVIKSIKHRNNVYSGPNTHYAPDLIFKPMDPRRPPLGDPAWARHVNRHLQTGWHREGGVLIYDGPYKSRLNTEDVVSLEAIAPSIATFMGCTVPAHCEKEAFIQ